MSYQAGPSGAGVGRVGVVLVVKDELHDIAGWLAWHIALGFDTILVFDDGSTDGTDAIVKAAAAVFDVRYAAIPQDGGSYYDRQQRQYMEVLAAARNEFAWLCFLDADEYLMLRRHDTVRQFLAGFPDADAIGINWRLYGSGGRMLRPLVPAPLAYLRHSAALEPINRHVKSFVRPDRQRGMVNVHCFQVEASRYVDSAGTPLHWHMPGIISGEPNWDTALVLHFQNRSMEHFLERVRKRSDITVDVRSWMNDAWEAEHDHAPYALAGRVFEILTRIELQNSAGLCRAIGASTPPRKPNWTLPALPSASVAASLADPFGPLRQAPERPRLDVFTVRSHWGAVLQADAASNLLVHATAARRAQGGLQPVWLIRRAADRQHALLLRAADPARPLRLLDDRQAMVAVPLECAPAADAPGKVTLASPSSGRFLGAEPPAPDGAGAVRADRRHAREWELFELEDADPASLAGPLGELVDAFFALPAGPLTAAALLAWVAANPLVGTAPLLQPMLRRLSRTEQVRLAASLPATVAPERVSGSLYS